MLGLEPWDGLNDFTPTGHTRYVPLGHSCGLVQIVAEARVRVDGWRFRHVCCRRPDFCIICAPELHPDHVVADDASGVTVRASILCPDCGTHGFVIASRWESC